MKTIKSRIPKLIFASLVLLVTMSFTSKKTCNDFFIDNSAFPNCTIEFDLTIYQGGACTSVCLGPNDPHQMAGGAILRLPCGTCTNQCDIEITITGVNGGSGTAPMKNFSNGNQVVSANSCGVAGISYSGGTFTIY